MMSSFLLVAALLGAVPEGQLSLQAGDLTVAMTSRAAWTIQTIEYQGQPLTMPLGGQGAVVRLNGQWLGAAVSAEPTEPVSALTVTVDGEEVAGPLPETLSGRKLVVTKQSDLGGLKHTAETTVEPDLIVQRHAFTATEAVSADPLQAFAYCCGPQAQQALSQAPDGQLLRYRFLGEGGHWPAQAVEWVAQYDTETQKGLLAFVTEPLPGQGGRLHLWDVRDCHKLFYQASARSIPTGETQSCSLVLQPFAASSEQWESRALELAEGIRRRFAVAYQVKGTGARGYGEGVPESGLLTCQTAHYRVPFAAEQGWTIYEMECDGNVFSGHNGFHGTVLTPRGGGFWGTGHAEGGAEVVHALRLTVDGQETPVKVGETVTGREISLRKESTIWRFRVVAEVTVTDDLVYERTQMAVLEDCSLDLMYYFMHCFVPSTTRYLATLPDGTSEEGPLGATETFAVNKDTRWVAQYEPDWGASILAYTPRVISGPGSASMIWDKAHYHKHYLRSNTERDLKTGEALDYSVVVKYIPGETGDWSATKAAVAAVVDRYPPE